MGLFDFIKSAGKSLGFGTAEAASKDTEDAELAAKIYNQRITGLLLAEVNKLGLGSDNLGILFSDQVVTVSGTTSSQENREKLILALGNIEGVAQVNENIIVEQSAVDSASAEMPLAETEPSVTEGVFYTVQSGDTLGKIAKQHYGSAGKYPVIFEANKPMLSDPDKIYPGQVLRIPPQA